MSGNVLLPCLCGSAVSIELDDDRRGWEIICHDACCPVIARDVSLSKDQMIAAWNRRVPSPATTGWTTITSDPATWPPDTASEILTEDLRGSHDTDTGAGMLESSRLGHVTGYRWHPWPAADSPDVAALLREVETELRKWWSFDDQQCHTHTWHDREDFIEKALPKLLRRAAGG